MKTRQEMIYDFMLALAGNYAEIAKDIKLYREENGVNIDIPDEVLGMAELLSDAYLESL